MTDIPTLVVWALVAGVGAFFGAYLREKGRNLATREDIAEVTRRIEAVRVQSAASLEALRQKHRGALTAIEPRLAAHQEAYQHWDVVIQNINGNVLGQCIAACREWLSRNWLYLDEKVRSALKEACERAESHAGIGRAGDPKAAQENLRAIERVGRIIEAAVALPAIADTMTLISIGEPEPRVIPTQVIGTAWEMEKSHE